MRVLMLCDLYPPFQGGIESYVYLLSRELVRRGHEVAVCTIGRPDLPSFEDVDGVRIHRFTGLFQSIPIVYRDRSRRWPPPLSDWKISRRLREIIDREQPDVIHAHGWMIYSLLPQNKQQEIPLVYTAHDFRLFCPKTILLRKDSVCSGPGFMACLDCLSSDFGLLRAMLAYIGVRYNRKRVQDVHALVAPSRFVRDAYKEHLPSVDRDIFTIPNFCPEYQCDEVGIDGELPEDYIVCVGWLMPHKGIDVLLESYRRLNTDTELVVIGIEHPKYSYQSDGRIHIVRNAPHFLVMDALSNSRFVVLPSICPECFPMVTIEAMSQKKAIIASRIGGLSEIVVDHETGLLVGPNSINELSEAMSTLLASPATAKAMGEKGYYNFIEHYTPEAVVPRIIEMYQRVTEGPAV